MWWAIQPSRPWLWRRDANHAGGRMIAALTMVMGFVMLAFRRMSRRFRGRNPSPRICRHLEHGCESSAVSFARRLVGRRNHALPSRAIRSGRHAYNRPATKPTRCISSPPAKWRLNCHKALSCWAKDSSLANRPAAQDEAHRQCASCKPDKLLVLDAFDLRILTRHNPEIGRRIEEVAASRADFTGAGDKRYY